MLNKLLLRFEFVRELQQRIAYLGEEVRCGREEIESTTKRLKAYIAEATASLEASEEKNAELSHSLEVERAKRMAAEQIAVSRGTELEWLRGQFQRAEDARDAAQGQQLESLNLVNLAMLKERESEAPPSKERLAEFKAVPKQQQAVPLIRKAQGLLIDGLRKKAREQMRSGPGSTSGIGGDTFMAAVEGLAEGLGRPPKAS